MDAIGIDLGTTNCCMAFVKNDKPEVLINDDGDRTTPSYICFQNNDILYGKAAMKNRGRNTLNTIYDVKRIIGRNYDDKSLEPLMDKWGFNVINSDGYVKIQVKINGKPKMYRPEILSGMLLRHLRIQAEKSLDRDISKVYITVPTYFNDAQRHATKDAGKLAGFKEVRLMNEPTAAAIAYAMDNITDEERIIFVFDFGGGTFDVSLIKCIGKNIKVLAIDGDINLGGNNVTANLMQYCTDKMMSEYNFDIKSNTRKCMRLEAMCEDAKRMLSFGVDHTLELHAIIPDNNEVDFPMTRAQFDKLNDNIFKKSIEVVERCLESSNLKKDQIDDILVVGGSTRIPKIIELLERYFEKPLKYKINPDEAVAIGAAIAASMWDGNEFFSDVFIEDICPYNLGVETDGTDMNIVIPKYSELPAKQTKGYVNSSDMQIALPVRVFSGNNLHTKHNTYLGTCCVTGFQPGPAGTIEVDVTFLYDESGILLVEACERSTGINNDLKIELDKGRLTEDELATHIQEIETEHSEVDKVRYFKALRHEVETFCNESKFTDSRKTICETTYQWMQTLTYSKDNSEELIKKYDMLQSMFKL